MQYLRGRVIPRSRRVLLIWKGHDYEMQDAMEDGELVGTLITLAFVTGQRRTLRFALWQQYKRIK